MMLNMKLILRPKDHKVKYWNVLTGSKAVTRIGEVAYAEAKDRSIAHMLVNSPRMLDVIRDMYSSLKAVTGLGKRKLTITERLFMSEAEGIITECQPMKGVR